MNHPEPDIDAIIDDIPAAHSGVYRLWLAVALHAIQSLKTGENIGSARTFLFDPDNPFLDAVCDGLQIEPESLRERVAKMGLNEQTIIRHGQDR